MLTFVASVLIFGVLIFFHELGHYAVAKKVGIGVYEFAIGFGPKLLSWRSEETDYSLRAFPLGGFVRLVGEDPEESIEEGSFQQKSVLSRFAVIAAGPIMNLLLAILLFSLIFFAFWGVPTNVIGAVEPGAPAEQVGLQEGDRIVSVAGEPVDDWFELTSRIHAHPDQEITIEFIREGQNQSVSVTPKEDPDAGVGLIGIGPEYRMYALFASLSRGVTYTFGVLVFFVTSIVQMITGAIAPDVMGPVGIIDMVGQVARTGMTEVLSLAALISLNLGVINLLPIPALDGSRLMFLLLEGVRGKPIDPQKESFVHFIGFTMLILLMLVVTFNDLVRLNIF
ncbi:RIP metalloprotease RseP [Dethiobacter alkaliphilus]|uniref:RIP metalloprotease RseP n=1 Tax=Dethiobacter alkaliphilus TaxID=427926 RepID=UPI002226044F|nr:RIP metalloprotease RseP [Dethiobacter alkaliphilus]MCW3490850.1 RIP metalloprotease RseP [Dethiobacter alkaliphilus]